MPLLQFSWALFLSVGDPVCGVAVTPECRPWFLVRGTISLTLSRPGDLGSQSLGLCPALPWVLGVGLESVFAAHAAWLSSPTPGEGAAGGSQGSLEWRSGCVKVQWKAKAGAAPRPTPTHSGRLSHDFLRQSGLCPEGSQGGEF